MSINNITAEEALRNAKTLSFDPSTGELFADGKMVGSASSLTREIMLSRLTDPSEHAEASDETLFDELVESV
jgi:hypothetical protein